MITITGATSVDQVLTEHPATAMVFLRRQMHCVGCPMARFESIADACRIYHVPVENFLTDLRETVDAGARSQVRIPG